VIWQQLGGEISSSQSQRLLSAFLAAACWLAFLAAWVVAVWAWLVVL